MGDSKHGVAPTVSVTRSARPGARRKADSRQPLDLAGAQQIGRFGLIRELARGGMGQVFLARDTTLGRKVAIKFLLHDDPAFVSRFVIEARATARCTHENIVTIYEVGEHAGLPFMVLEYLEGTTLSQVVERRLGIRALFELLVPIVRALERAHEHGFVHRDLKPSNIFVTDRGVVKVLDFGIAKCFEAGAAALHHLPESDEHPDAELTYITFAAGGALVGTVPYMSPEQWGAGEVDHTTDLWAIGILCWRALVGVHPAGTITAEKLRARLIDRERPLPSIATRDPEMPAAAAAIIDRCLALPRADRYPTAAALLADLQAFLGAGHVRDTDACPYRGLAAFGEDDASSFFGRDSEIRTALGKLEGWPLLAVIGPSGVGKSSFVHAGLVPAVRAAGAWSVRVLRPGRTPIAALAGAMHATRLAPHVVENLAAQLDEAPGMFGDALRREAIASKQRVLLVVDQLEELFTLSSDDDARRTFLAALLGAADDPSSPVRVVLSMRADFLDRLAAHEPFLAELSRGLMFLSAPDHDNLEETLVRPAELAGYRFEDPGIVEGLLAAATSRGALPLLQFAATRLWDARDRKHKLLTTAAYHAMGGIGGAFARHADDVAAAVPAHQQPLLRSILTRLVTPESTRAVVDRAELTSLSADPGEVAEILDQLVRARLVHVHTDPVHGATVELVHEVLITEWPTLRRWLDDNGALRGFLHELREAARAWAARGTPADLVWRGSHAQEALAIVRRHAVELAGSSREFVAAIRAQASRARRRRALVIGAIFALLALVIAGGSIAFVRISAAEKVATQKAQDESAALAKAKAAEAQATERLAAFLREKAAKEAADQQRLAAEERATSATAAVALSREELEKALTTSLHDKAVAVQAAAAAATAADAARKATADATAATDRLKLLLAAEQARVRALEAERRKIATSLRDPGPPPPEPPAAPRGLE